MDRRAVLYFILVALFWGVPYFFIKIALQDVSPAVVALARVVIGALVLLPIALRTGVLRQLQGKLGAIVVLALLEVVMPFVLIPSGEQQISSSLTGILIATEPMFVALLAFPIDHTERLRGTQFIGLSIGLLGVVVLLGLDRAAQHHPGGALLILLATLQYALGALMVKRWFSTVSSVAVVVATLAVGTAVLAIPAALSWPHTMPSGTTLGALLILGVACTGLGFLFFFALIGLAGAGRATLITYVAPAVAVLLGVGLRGEAFTGGTAAGLALIVLGSWIATHPPVLRAVRGLARGSIRKA